MLKTIILLNPTAIITTNYDEFLEKIVFKKFKTTVGQKIIKEHLKGNNGKILKIHGCVTKPETIVISELDYENFIFRQKYLSAKLLTYFVEYPIIIMGYSISDRNILSILQTISEINILGESIKQRADNIWFINYSYSNLDEYDTLLEKEIVLPNNKVIVINIINVRAFDKLFQSIINTNQFPFSLTAVAVELDYTHWKQIEKYMDAIEKTDNLKISDNIKYCTKYKSIKRYSEEFYKRVKQVKSSSSGV